MNKDDISKDDVSMLLNRIKVLENKVIAISKENAKLRDELNELRRQGGFQYIISDILQINSKSKHAEKNLSTSLRSVAEYIGGDMAFMLQENKGKSCPYVVSTVKSEDSSLDDKLFKDKFALEDYFKDIADTTHNININEIYKGDYELPIFDKVIDEYHLLSQIYGINRLSMIPIIINKDNIFYLGVANVKENHDLSSLEYFAGIYRDILERIVDQNTIREMAITDNATGLYDRGHFNYIAQKYKQGYEGTIAFIMLDLYRLKFVNDTFGHETGDRYIQITSDAIKEAFKNDMAFRYGGDEFCVICQNNTEEQIKRKLEYVGTIVKETNILPNNQGNPNLVTHVDSGYAISDGNLNFGSLITKADENLSASKADFYKKIGVERRK